MAVTQFSANEYVSRANVNSRVTEINNMFPVSVANGGTGATSLNSGEILLGNGTGSISSTATLPVSKGGTGATTAATARQNLEVMKKFVLYSNSSGTYSTITLNDSVENYDAIGIYYFWNHREYCKWSNCYSEFSTTGGGYLTNVCTPGDGNGVAICAKQISFTGRTLSFASVTYNRGIYISCTHSSYSEDPFWGNYADIQVRITKVVGYKY